MQAAGDPGHRQRPGRPQDVEALGQRGRARLHGGQVRRRHRAHLHALRRPAGEGHRLVRRAGGRPVPLPVAGLAPLRGAAGHLRRPRRRWPTPPARSWSCAGAPTGPSRRSPRGWRATSSSTPASPRSWSCVNELTGLEPKADAERAAVREALLALATLLGPFAPHVAEELWHEVLGPAARDRLLADEPWPAFDPALVRRRHRHHRGAGERQAARRGAARRPRPARPRCGRSPRPTRRCRATWPARRSRRWSTCRGGCSTSWWRGRR